MVMILVYAVWMGIDADWNSAMVITDSDPLFQFADHFFCPSGALRAPGLGRLASSMAPFRHEGTVLHSTLSTYPLLASQMKPGQLGLRILFRFICQMKLALETRPSKLGRSSS